MSIFLHPIATLRRLPIHSQPCSETVNLTRTPPNRSCCACPQTKSARDDCFLKIRWVRGRRKMQSARARALGMHAESGLQDLDGRWDIGTGASCVYPVYVPDADIYYTPLCDMSSARAATLRLLLPRFFASSLRSPRSARSAAARHVRPVRGGCGTRVGCLPMGRSRPRCCCSVAQLLSWAPTVIGSWADRLAVNGGSGFVYGMPKQDGLEVGIELEVQVRKQTRLQVRAEVCLSWMGWGIPAQVNLSYMASYIPQSDK
jgi:hypothetical protein